MVLFPLLYVLPILGVFGAFLIVAIAMALSAWLQSRRAFQSQLLWLITIAIRNQLPLADEFRNLAINTGVKRRLALNQAAQDLEHGDTLSMALERSRLLPASMISAIRVSEGGAHYEEALRRLATYSTERLKSYGLSRLSEVFVQVVTILSAWVFIVGFLMYYIIPKFAEIFRGFDEELPRSTRALIDFSDNFMFASSAVVFWVGIGIVLFCWQTLRHIVGWSSLSLPAVMYWFPRRDAPEVLRALAGITTGMTPLPQQILQLTNRPGRPDLGARYHRISESIRSGQTLSHSLHAEGLLTPLQCEAVAAGERGGQLSFILFSLADAIDQRELRQSADWAEMLKPFVVVVSGLVTGFIVFAMFVPLVKLISRLS
jgi:type II secretory pathway component PulF